MNALPRMSEQAPYQWEPCVVLRLDDIQMLLAVLPDHLRKQLRHTAEAAATLAMRLNQIERPGRKL